MTEEKKQKVDENLDNEVVENTENENSTENENKELTPEEKIEKLEAELEDMKLNFLRARADYDNFRKRSQEELVLARDRAIISFVEDLLPSIDNFEMSLKMTDNTDMFIKGVEMIHNNLVNTLNDHKFQEFTAKVGDEFNPVEHEPIPVENEDGEEGKVLAILKPGIKHKDKIVRPVKVQVKKVE